MQLATKIFNRMTEAEKIIIRAASPAQLEYLGDTSYRVDMPSETMESRCATMDEIYALCKLEFLSKTDCNNFGSVTWRF